MSGAGSDGCGHRVFPLEPLIPHLRRWATAHYQRPDGGGTRIAGALATLTGIDYDSARQKLAYGRLSAAHADRAAIALGLHPVLIWPELWCTHMIDDIDWATVPDHVTDLQHRNRLRYHRRKLRGAA